MPFCTFPTFYGCYRCDSEQSVLIKVALKPYLDQIKQVCQVWFWLVQWFRRNMVTHMHHMYMCTDYCLMVCQTITCIDYTLLARVISVFFQADMYGLLFTVIWNNHM